MINLKNVTANDDYTLTLEFDNHEIRTFDVKPYIEGDWFGRLSDAAYFRTVHMANGTVEWADGQDIAPHELYELSVRIK